MSLEAGIDLAIKLREFHRFAKIIHGDSLDSKCEPFKVVLRGIANKERITVLAALRLALEIGAEKITEGDQLLFCASAVEVAQSGECEPTRGDRPQTADAQADGVVAKEK